MTLHRVLMGLALVMVITVLAVPFAHSVAACDALPQDKGQSAHNVTVTTPGTYRLWLRMAAPTSARDSAFVQVDSQCPITVGDGVSGDGWLWVNFQNGDSTKPITIDLTVGEHTVTLAGREAGVGVDKVMFVGNAVCTPVAYGDNCLAATTSTTGTKTTPAKAVSASSEASKWLGMPKGIVMATSAIIVLGALGFVVVKYILFERRMTALAAQAAQDSLVIVDGAPYQELNVPRKLLYFVRHHLLFIMPAGFAIVGGIAIVFAAAASAYPVFEAEAGTLSGSATIVADATASGGKYALFDTKAGGMATGLPIGGTNNSSASGGSSSGGSTGGGSSGSSGACASNTPHVPDGPDGAGGCWPGASNTGVPGGITLANYTGPCTITAPNTVIDAKNITCQILVRADNLTIKRSHLTDGVSGLEADGASFRIEDSWIDNGICSNCSVDGWNFTILRTEITGGNRGAYCMHVCLIQDSWVHATGLDPNSQWHASAVRAEQYTTLKHNVLHCDYTGPFNDPELGCSADMSGYPDFVPIHHNTIDHNLFGANPDGLGFCAYGGGTLGKPYSSDPLNATYIVFTDNVFQRGTNNKCGTWGAITDFIVGRTGNQWTNNKWTDGAIVDPE